MVISGIVIAIGLVIAYKLIKKPIVPATNSGSTNTGGGTGANTGNGGGVSLDFSRLSNDLFIAFDGYGTDNTTVINTFSALKSDADFDAIVSAYGVKEISSGVGNVFVKNFKGDLIKSVINEMSTGEITQINNILKSNGISKQIK